MKFILGIIISACLLFTSCEEAIDGHDVTDFRIINNSSKDITLSLNNSSIFIKSKNESYVSSPKDSKIEIDTVNNHIDYKVRYGVFHNKAFYNYIEIEDIPTYEITAYNTYSQNIKLIYGKSETDFIILPAIKLNSETNEYEFVEITFTSYLKKDLITAYFDNTENSAINFVCFK